MGASHIAELAVLAAGTACLCLSCVGVLTAHTAYARLHFLGPAGVLGMPLIAAAIVIAHGFDTAGTMACLVALTSFVLGPFQAHLLGRALRVREFGHWVLLPGERDEAS